MSSNEPFLDDAPAALCVSIHDVAPCTWPQCAQLLQAIAAVAPIPLTLLVVPNYHHQPVVDAIHFDRVLDTRLACGDELALHGFTHLDEGPPARNWWQKFVRTVYTTGEGEFSAIDVAEAQRRIELGLTWFAQRHWAVEGFVAPAWLMGAGAWQALAAYHFRYTTTVRDFYLLPEQRALHSPSLVYAARNGYGRWLSAQRNALLSQTLVSRRVRPLVRLGLHPADAAYPYLIRDFQRLLERLLLTHRAMTKAEFAHSWQLFYRDAPQQGRVGHA